ncbi:MAG: nucleotidyltransferase family protein [Parvularculaceae bacterium]
MVLAAGLGLRMRPLSDARPKPLIEVAGKPLIDYALDRFADAGVSRAVVNVHHLADMMEAHLSSRTAPEILISDERALLLETGGGLKKARRLLGDAPFYCTNTDAILIDAPGRETCAALAETWDGSRMDALLLLTPLKTASGYAGAGDFTLDADGRLEFRREGRAPYVFTGLQILSPSLLAGAPDGPFSTRLLWDRALAAGRLYGVVHEGTWMHVGDPQGLKDAEARLAAPREDDA